MAVAALGAFFVVRGRLNADEGWYLYSSRLVYRGELPFRDFSFTQMPLLPYLYGLVQLMKPSLYLGRLVSLVLLTGAVAMSVRVAWREAGRAAAVAVGLLVLLAPTAVYNLTLTKTYALVAFFLAALLLTLTSPGRRTLMFPLAAAAAVGLALSRSSGLPLAAIVLVYLLWRAPDRRTRVWVAGISAVGALAVAGFVLVDVHAARFDLSTFHQLLWHGADTGTRLDTIVTTRIPDWFGEYWGYVLLVGGAVVALATSAEVRQYAKRQPAYLLLTVGTVIYLGSQLTPGQFAPVEYAAAVVPLVITIPVILISRRLFGPDGTVPAFRGAALAGVAIVVVLGVVTVVHPGVGEFVVDRELTREHRRRQPRRGVRARPHEAVRRGVGALGPAGDAGVGSRPRAQRHVRAVLLRGSHRRRGPRAALREPGPAGPRHRVGPPGDDRAHRRRPDVLQLPGLAVEQAGAPPADRAGDRRQLHQGHVRRRPRCQRPDQRRRLRAERPRLSRRRGQRAASSDSTRRPTTNICLPMTRHTSGNRM